MYTFPMYSTASKRTMKISTKHPHTPHPRPPVLHHGVHSDCKKAIFLCVFLQDNYLKLLYLLLESLYIYGNLDDNTDIIIYTTTPYAEQIKKSELFSTKMVFQINDQIHDLESACFSRLEVFDFPFLASYEKIMYLDIDILILHDINPLFDLIEKDVIYAKKEDVILDQHDFHGRTFFERDGNVEETYGEDMSAFSTGVMLFKTSEVIRDLFSRIREHARNNIHPFYDQPHVNYIAKKLRMVDNTLLDKLVVMYEEKKEFLNTYTLIHFSGGVGTFDNKYQPMSSFLFQMKRETIHNVIQYTKFFIDTQLMPILRTCGENVEGNLFMKHHDMIYTDDFTSKQQNLVSLLLNQNVEQVMEIGFNSGFSSLLMLIANPYVKLTCVDIGEHKYVKPCFEVLQKEFGERIQLVIGDSVQVLADMALPNKFDMIHVDGGHNTFLTSNDIINAHRLVKPGGVIVLDDYDFEELHRVWDMYRNGFRMQPVSSMTFPCDKQDIRVKRK